MAEQVNTAKQEAIRAGQGNDLIAFVRAMHQQADGVRDPPVISRQEYGEQDEF